jgi:subtilase family serine protease
LRISTVTRSRRRRLPLALTAATTAAASVVLGLAGPAQAAGNVAYPHSVPTWATAARDAGKTPAAETVEGEIYLPIRDATGATALATAVSTPGSPQYRHWVTPQQWINRFSPPAGEYNRLVAFLKHGGFTITGTPDSRLFVVFRGTTDQMDKLFGTSMHTYSVDGKRLAAPSTAPQLPADIASTVTGMELDQGRLLTHPDSATPSSGGSGTSGSATSQATPNTAPSTAQCSDYYGQHTATLPAASGQTVFNTAICGYVPSQLRSAYDVPSSGSPALAASGRGTGLDGAGQTVAIIDAYASPTILQDVNTYSGRRGEPALTAFSQIKPGTFYDQELCGFPSGWQGEQNLDVEAVHGIAPAAGVLYVGGFNCGGGIDVALSKILDNHLATIVSNSYGDVGEAVPPDAIMGQENQHLQAVAEGIGLYYSSGDYGDEAASLGTPQPDYEASSPWVTSVGGTSTGIDRNGTVAAETGWGSHRDQVTGGTYATPLPGAFLFGAGGGRSTVFAQPDYQRGVVPTSLARGMRVSPDIAADADPYTGMLIGLRPITNDTTLATGPYVEEAIGGTSLASPLVAAQMALVQQLTGTTLGFANPAVYALHRAVPSVPRDVSTTAALRLAFTSQVSGNTYLVTGNRDTSLVTRPGYDDVTGLGAIDFEFLRRAMAG